MRVVVVRNQFIDVSVSGVDDVVGAFAMVFVVTRTAELFARHRRWCSVLR